MLAGSFVSNFSMYSYIENLTFPFVCNQFSFLGILGPFPDLLWVDFLVQICRVVVAVYISFSIALTPLLSNAISHSLILSCIIILCVCVFGSNIYCSSDFANANCTLYFGLGHRLYLSFILFLFLHLQHVFISVIMFMPPIVTYSFNSLVSSSGIIIMLSYVSCRSCSCVWLLFVVVFWLFSLTPVIVSSCVSSCFSIVISSSLLCKVSWLLSSYTGMGSFSVRSVSSLSSSIIILLFLSIKFMPQACVHYIIWHG